MSARSEDSVKRREEILDAVQFSLQEEVNTEIRNYLSRGPWLNNIDLSRIKNPYDAFEVHFPCLEIVLNRVNADNDQPSQRVLDILRLAIAATNPQKKRHVARSIVIPFRQRRAQLKKYLVNRVETVLKPKGFSAEKLRELHISVQALHSRFKSSKRNIAKVIEEQNSKLTKCSTHEYQMSRQSTQKLVPRTQCCTAVEWDARHQMLKNSQDTIQRNMKTAHTKRANMSALKL